MPTFVSQGPIDYGITGSRRWQDLGLHEQDEYLLACFDGERARQRAEARLQLFDRAGGSLADGLLGLYRQRVGEVARYEPGTPEQAREVLALCREALGHTPLGRRLAAAVERQRGKMPVSSPELEFYSVAPAVAGMEVLSETCCGQRSYEALDEWPHEVNNFELLHRAQRRRLPARRASDALPLGTSTVAAAAQVPRTPASPVTTKAVADPSSARASESAWPYFAPALAAAPLLVIALVGGPPYGFYMLLRLVVCGVAAYFCVRALAQDFAAIAWIAGGAAILYNPLLPMRLGRDVWEVVNAATILFLLAAAALLWRRAARAS